MRLAFLALSLWILTFATAFADDSLSIEPRDGVLVLRNGFVMPGRITKVGDSYLVSFGDRGEARMHASTVEFECRSMDEAYRIKRDALESDDAHHHLQLADWCMRHGVMAGAADQLLIARVLEPKNATLETLERRLHSLATMAARPPAPVARSAVAQASHTKPVQPTALQDIEPFLVQQFTVTIQPILLNRCATHACHGAAGSTAYKLLRPSLGQAATSRLTQRNLQSTLAFINRGQPEASLFLTMATQPHGAVAQAVFEEKAATQLELINAWVRRLGMRFNEPAPGRTPGEMRAPKQPTRVISTPQETPAPAGATPQPADPAPESADPFDPDEFNRRFHGK